MRITDERHIELTGTDMQTGSHGSLAARHLTRVEDRDRQGRMGKKVITVKNTQGVHTKENIQEAASIKASTQLGAECTGRVFRPVMYK